VWFNNSASRHAKEDRPAKSKADTCGHLTSTKSWNTKSICGQIFTEHISDEQKRLSEYGDKAIRKYQVALLTVFEALSAAELKRCRELAIKWNISALSDEVQCK
jgi:hypothetical protein